MFLGGVTMLLLMQDVSNESPVFGEAIKAARKSRGWSQSHLALQAGVSLPTVQRAERSDHRVKFSMVGKIATGLEVPVTDLYDVQDVGPRLDDVQPLWAIRMEAKQDALIRFHLYADKDALRAVETKDDPR